MSTYTSTAILGLDTSTPTEGVGNSFIPELNDAIREIKTAIKNNASIATKTTTYTITGNDNIILCNGTFTITLPQQSAVSSATVAKEYTLINIGSGTVTITPYAGDTLSVASLATLQVIKIAGNGGTAWRISGGNYLSGTVSIGNTNSTHGLELSGGASETAKIGGKAGSNGRILVADGDIAHGVTDIAPTDTIGLLAALSGNGGLAVEGFSSDAGQTPLDLVGTFGVADPTDTIPGVQITANKKSGTGVQNLGAAETIFGVRNGSSGSSLVVLGNGFQGLGKVPVHQLDLSTDDAGKPSTSTWTIVCDKRLKGNIVDANLERCYEIVKTLPLRHFALKDDVYTKEQAKDRSKLGWISQEVQAVFPKSVSESKFTGVPYEDGVEEYEEQESEIVDVDVKKIEMVDGKAVMKVVKEKTRVLLTDKFEVVDEKGKPVFDKDGKRVVLEKRRMIKKTRPKMSAKTIDDCLSLNTDQIYAAMFGCIKMLIQKVEDLEAQINKKG